MATNNQIHFYATEQQQQQQQQPDNFQQSTRTP